MEVGKAIYWSYGSCPMACMEQRLPLLKSHNSLVGALWRLIKNSGSPSWWKDNIYNTSMILTKPCHLGSSSAVKLHDLDKYMPLQFTEIIISVTKVTQCGSLWLCHMCDAHRFKTALTVWSKLAHISYCCTESQSLWNTKNGWLVFLLCRSCQSPVMVML